MQKGQRQKSWKRFLHCGRPSVSVYAGAIVILLMGASANAASNTDGFSFQTSGIKISLKLNAPEGTKLMIQRAGQGS